MRLTLLSRAYCHLCDDMRDQLAALLKGRSVQVVELDVDAHPALDSAYGDLVPMLLLGDTPDGVELCHYHLDADAVLRALDAG